MSKKYYIIIITLITIFILLFTFISFVYFNEKLTVHEILNSQKQLVYRLTYKGKKIVEENFYDNNIIRYSKKYDTKNSNILEEINYNNFGNIINISNYKYLNKKVIEKNVYDGNKKLLFQNIYNYDKNGFVLDKIYKNISKDKTIINKLEKDYSEISEFDSNNRLIKIEKKKPESFEIIKFNPDNQKVVYNLINHFNDKKINEKIFDENGILLRDATYNHNGKLIIDIVYKDNEIISNVSLKYNEQGKEIERVEYNGKDMKVVRKYIYEYDAFGNRVRVDVYDTDGNKLDYY